MKIGILAIHPFHGSLGTMDVISETSKELVQMGVEIHIFTPFEEDSIVDGIFIHKISSDASKFGLESRFYSLIRRIYSSPFITRNIVLKRRTIEAAASSLEKSLMPQLKKLDIDILQGEQDIPALACIHLGKKLKLPVIAHIRNFWPEESVDIGLIKRKSSTYRGLHNLIGDIVQEADLVFSVSAFAKQFLVNEYTVSSEKVVEIPRGARPLATNINYASKAPSAVYSGSISPHENLPLFIKSMPFVKEKIPDSAFYLTGKGDYTPKVQDLLKKTGVDAPILWFEKKTDAQAFLSNCGVGVIPWANTFSRQFGFPIKLLHYLSVGLPVVMTNVGEWAEIIKNEGIGLVAEPEPERFADAITELLTDKKLAKASGRRGLNLIKTKYNWTNTAKVALYEYNKLLKKN